LTLPGPPVGKRRGPFKDKVFIRTVNAQFPKQRLYHPETLPLPVENVPRDNGLFRDLDSGKIITQQLLHLCRIEALLVTPLVEPLSATRAYGDLRTQILTAGDSAQNASAGFQYAPNLLEACLGHLGRQVLQHFGHHDRIEEGIRERQLLDVTHLGLATEMQGIAQLSDAPFAWVE